MFSVYLHNKQQAHDMQLYELQTHMHVQIIGKNLLCCCKLQLNVTEGKNSLASKKSWTSIPKNIAYTIQHYTTHTP